jgi:hypothetical protein
MQLHPCVASGSALVIKERRGELGMLLIGLHRLSSPSYQRHVPNLQGPLED